jgi:Magnesium chelatase, subunit ChlI
MAQVQAVTLTPERRGLALATAGGLIVVGGPPFHGKSILAARLAEVLPFAHKLEAVDNLATTSEYWDPTGLMVRPYQKPLARMLRMTTDIWARRSPSPVIVIAARSASPAVRQLARRTAASAGMQFLHIEAFAHSIRAFERLSSLMLPKDELMKRMHRYEVAMRQYVRVTGEEEKRLPSVRLRNVLSNCDAAAQVVLRRWLRGR